MINARGRNGHFKTHMFAVHTNGSRAEVYVVSKKAGRNPPIMFKGDREQLREVFETIGRELKSDVNSHYVMTEE